MTKIEKLLTELNERVIRIEQRTADVMNSDTAAQFLGMSKSSFDKITRPKNMLIPVVKIGGKKKVFMDFIEKCKQESIII